MYTLIYKEKILILNCLFFLEKIESSSEELVGVENIFDVIVITKERCGSYTIMKYNYEDKNYPSNLIIYDDL